ncbi:MAG: GNAT family N-acetyltransferase [Clostridiales bacterium]|nr:GNAT family N-acetyltransferase [Clostridiales bacterium]
MQNAKLTIRETTEADLENVLALWNDGEVMRYVGFPDGLGVDLPCLDRWLEWIESGRPLINHYSVYAEEIGYCGETFYRIDPQREHKAAMDIKLFPAARGQGIASAALSFAIGQAFANGASRVWVDPNPENKKALALYRRLGFVEKPYPRDLRDGDQPVTTIYFELQKPQ